MNFTDLVSKARTTRRYTKKDISLEILSHFVNLASLTPSARNAQLARYIIVHTEENIEKMDKCINLSGLNYEKRLSEERMHPRGYIIICSEANLGFFATVDLGIIAQTMQIAAIEQGIGTCMVGAFNKVKLLTYFGELMEEARLEPYLVMAFGYPDEEVVIMPEDKEKPVYWRDEKKHYVQKNSPETNTLAII